MKQTIFCLLISLVFLSTLYVAEAQTTPSGILEPEISLTLNPTTPTPGQGVTANVASFSTNLNSDSIVWLVNGKNMASGIGQKDFSFTAGPKNTTTTLEVDVTTENGTVLKKTYTMNSSSVDLIWQADGYVPPFYRGKTLFSYEDNITFLAIPHILSHGSEISPGSLIYTWKVNGEVQGDDSGYGKNVYRTTGSVIARPMDVEVDVSLSTNSNVVAATETTVNPEDPKALLYQKSPLYGIQFQKALQGNITLSDTKEIQIVAEPFFFGVNNPYSGMDYIWMVNNSMIDTNTTEQSRIFRPQEGASGTSNISLQLTNSLKQLQLASGGFSLTFNTTNSPSF